MSRIAQFTVLVLLLTLTGAPCHAAKKPTWETLTDCKYVESKDNDGDSFRVRCGEKGFVVRLYFVDAPETNLSYADRTREQASHFGITLDETMRAGEKATEAVAKALAKPFVVHTTWSTARGRSKEPRYYAFVEADGKNLAEVLVSQGLARTKGQMITLPTGEKDKALKNRLEILEREARKKRLDAWATSTRKVGDPQSQQN